MLRIFSGDMSEPSAYGPSWFKYGYEPGWFEDPFVQSMIQDVDKSEYKSGMVIESPALGHIPPERLSGGVQTLIMIYKMPDKIFDATSCGPNCAKWLIEIGKRVDVTINLNYAMPFDGLDPFDVEILNAKCIVHTADDLILTCLDFIKINAEYPFLCR